MEFSLLFFLNSTLLGIGLAMDAFSVSLANGLNEPKMKKNRMCGIAGIFAVFQAIMPMLGWICVHTIVKTFQVFEKFIPWIALILLAYIGGKMLIEGIKNKNEECMLKKITISVLMVQGIATSIDALSVGFTIANYNWLMALICAIIIAVVTFVICMIGLALGKKMGTSLSREAAILGGIILIVIGLEIFIGSI